MGRTTQVVRPVSSIMAVQPGSWVITVLRNSAHWERRGTFWPILSAGCRFAPHLGGYGIFGLASKGWSTFNWQDKLNTAAERGILCRRPV